MSPEPNGSTTPVDYAARVDAAQIYDVARKTPLVKSAKLSNRLGNTVLLKREDLQPIFTFKVRGATNKLACMPQEQLDKGVICSSAGNHAQGVALAAAHMGVDALIVMPEATSSIKVEAVEALGATVQLHGETYDDAQQLALSIAAERDLSFVHPFEDPDVIAGQGTIGKELLEQQPDLDVVFLAVGGGGLAAGVASYIKSKKPNVLIIGVEPEDSASMKAAFDAGAPVQLDHVGTFAESVATKVVGQETFRLCQEYVDDIITATTDEMCAAIKDVFEATRTVVEPAGALALAGLKQYALKSGWKQKTLIAVNCGANMNFERLRHISERAAVGEHIEVLLAVEIPEEKGSFLNFCAAIGNRHVTEFNYRYQSDQTAHVFVGLERSPTKAADGQGSTDEAFDELHQQGYTVTDLTDNELAKIHIRHLVGGTSPKGDEHLFRFEFPERRGALLRFLQAVGTDWNITLFHYRNYGSDYGQVLVGLDVPPDTSSDLHQHFDALGYRWWEESKNPAYQLFLQGAN